MTVQKITEYLSHQRHKSRNPNRTNNTIERPPPPAFNQTEFPGLRPSRFSTKLLPPTSGHQQEEYVSNKSTNMNSNNSNNMSYANTLNTNRDNNLFSLTEINSLIKDIILNLSNCSNRFEQFHIITNLAIKYLYGK